MAVGAVDAPRAAYSEELGGFYRKLALALHPDKRCPHPSATDAFHAVTKACRDIEERVHGSG